MKSSTFLGSISINPLTKDEVIAIDQFRHEMKKDAVKVVVCILDATRLERSLVFGLQARREAQKYNKAIVFALNMMDEVSTKNINMDIKGLEWALGTPVFGISSKTGEGLVLFKRELKSIVAEHKDFIPAQTLKTDEEILAFSKKLGQRFGAGPNIILKDQNKWDRFFLHSVSGGASFFLIMIFLFQSIFTWSAPLMDFTETIIVTTGNGLRE